MAVNQETLNGHWNEIKGKLRERWGQLSADELDTVHGDVEQLVGTIEQKTGEARDAVESYLEELTNDGKSFVGKAVETVRGAAESAKESVQGAAKHAAGAVKAGYSKAEETVQKRPATSLGVCFAAGVVTGVLVGLLIRRR